MIYGDTYIPHDTQYGMSKNLVIRLTETHLQPNESLLKYDLLVTKIGYGVSSDLVQQFRYVWSVEFLCACSTESRYAVRVFNNIMDFLK